MINTKAIALVHTEHTGQVAEELLVRARRQERYPMVLTACSWASTRKLSDANEHGEIAKPDKYEAVYQTSRSTAAKLS
jgi:hypothetical protein